MSGFNRQNFYKETERLPDINAHQKPLFPVWVEALKTVLLFGVIGFAALYAAYDFGEGTLAAMLYALGIFFIPALSTVIRRLSKYFVPFLLLHASLGLYAAAAPHIALAALSGFCAAVCLLYSMVRKLSREGERELSAGTLVFVLAVQIVIFAFASFRHHESYEGLLLAGSLIYTALFLFYQHRTSMLNAIRNIAQEGNYSSRQMVRFNTGMYALYMLGGAALFAILYFLGFSDVLRAGGRFLLLLIRRGMRLLFSLSPTEETVSEELAEEEAIQQDLSAIFGREQETWLIWVILEKIAIVLVTGALIVGALYLIILFFKRFHHAYRYEGSGYEEIKSFYGREDESVKVSGRRLFERGPADPVRRMYYKLVKKAMGKSVTPSDTPKEVGEKLPEVKAIREAYEETRYGAKTGDFV